VSIGPRPLPAFVGKPLAIRYLFGVAALTAGLLSGCGRSVTLGEVDGTVRLDGQPLGQVLVVFVPEDPQQPQSMGITDAEGHFKLRCNNSRSGAVVGPHRVTLVDANMAPGGRKRDDEPEEGAARPVSRVPEVYSRTDRTPLRQTVAAGTQTISLEIPAEQKPG
jgi:hypothetical protein